jgi:YggT family protein
MVPTEIMASLEPATTVVSTLTSSLTIAETQAWVQPTATILDPVLNLLCVAMLARVVLSWYPETKETEMPWLLLVIPTQPLLKAIKGVIPPAFGVDSK